MPTTYIICYDLSKPGQDYSDLIKAIQAYGTYCHLQQSVWLIAADAKATEIRDNLKKYLDANDKLFVAKASAPAAWTGTYGDKIGDWLREVL